MIRTAALALLLTGSLTAFAADGGQSTPDLAKAKQTAETVCAACHGPDGKGNPALGAPNLTSGVFMHGPAVESHIVAMITNGKTGVMPAWDKKFTPEQIKLLTAYVWGKGGGVAPPAAN